MIELQTVGRAAELARLQRVADGDVRAVLLEGEPGIGKTHLLDRVADYARRGGMTVWRASCDELDATRPLAALLSVLPTLADTPLSAPSDDLLSGLAAHATAEESLLVAAQRHVEQGLPGPTVLLVDDVQWADRVTVLLLHRLSRGSSDLRLVCAARPLPRSAELAALARGIETLHVAPLSPAEARLLAEVVAGPLSGDGEETIDAAGGHPLLVLVLAAAVRDGDHHFRLASVADAVGRSVAAASPDAQQLVRLAAVQGTRLSLPLLAAVAQRPVVELLPLVSELLAAGLLVDRGTELVFRHDLVRDAIESVVPVAVRRALHVETARVLEEMGAPLPAVASHLALGAEPGDARAAVRLRKAGAAVALHAPAAALELLRHAAEVARGTAEAERTDAELAVVLAFCGAFDESETIAAGLLARSSDPAVRVLCHRGIAAALAGSERFAAAADHLSRALEEPGLSEGERSRLFAELAYSEVAAPNRTGAEQHARAALAYAEGAGDVPTAQLALTALAFAHGWRGDCTQAIAFAKRALALAGDDDLGSWDQARFVLAVFLSCKDRLDEARAVLLTGLAEARRRGLVWRASLYLIGLGSTTLDAGDISEADAYLRAAFAELDSTAEEFFPVMCRFQRIRAALYRGDLAAAKKELDEARSTLARMGQATVKVSVVHIAAAALFDAEGQADRALQELREAVAVLAAAGDRLTLLEIAPAFVRLLVHAGATEEAADVVSAAEGTAALLDAPSGDGHALLARAHLTRAPEDYVAALDAYRRSPRRLHHVIACLEAAPLLAEHHRDDAVAVLDEALRTAEACGAHGLAVRARAELRSLGVRPGARGRRTRATHGWESLTPAEERVVELVAEGLSNQEVAARLFVSRATVESHLKRVFAKLGVTSRLQVASEARRRAAPAGAE